MREYSPQRWGAFKLNHFMAGNLSRRRDMWWTDGHTEEGKTTKSNRVDYTHIYIDNEKMALLDGSVVQW